MNEHSKAKVELFKTLDTLQLQRLADPRIDNDADAQAELGWRYIHQKNYEHAVYYSELAANQNNDRGRCNLGVCYAMGLGVDQNYEKAFKLFLAAAVKGNVFAQFNVGSFYLLGKGVAKDADRGQDWLQKAWDKGYPLVDLIGPKPSRPEEPGPDADQPKGPKSGPQ